MKYLKRKSRDFVITFIDFKKAYDSTDRESLFEILNKFGLDKKTTDWIEQTLSWESTTPKLNSELKFLDSFKLRQESDKVMDYHLSLIHI